MQAADPAPVGNREASQPTGGQGVDVAYAKITYQWDDDTVTVCEVGTDEPSHPDLLDELVKRVLTLWGVTVDADDEPDVETGG